MIIKDLSNLDKVLRGTNFIFHGVSEKTSVELGTDDNHVIDKIKNVIQKTGLSNMAGIDNIRIKRLGETQSDQDKPRAILLK